VVLSPNRYWFQWGRTGLEEPVLGIEILLVVEATYGNYQIIN
jgi:hypothetical protein